MKSIGLEPVLLRVISNSPRASFIERVGREEALAKAEKKMVELRGNQFADEAVIEAAMDRLEEVRSCEE